MISLINTSLIIIIILVIYYIWAPTPKPERSLYDRLGGVYVIAELVDHFSDSLFDNPILGRNSPNPLLADWHTNHRHRLPGLKFMRTLWMCDVSGGPQTYQPIVTGTCPLALEKVHNKYKITDEEFGEAFKELANSLNHFNTPDDVKKDALKMFAKLRKDHNFEYKKTIFSTLWPFGNSCRVF